MTTEFKLPELGEGVESADIARIFVEPGDQIEADQNVMELETERRWPSCLAPMPEESPRFSSRKATRSRSVSRC